MSKEKKSEELIIANKELIFQNKEKEKRAAELVIANKELAFQNEEKGKRAAELAIANKELAFQNEEKGKRAAELTVANKELAFQNEEKEKRAAELTIANKELAFQNDEKEKRTVEFIIANEKITKANHLYSFISHINKTIVRVKDEQTLFNEACRIAVDIGKFKMAWIGIADEAAGKINLVASYGAEESDIVTLSDNTYDSRGATDSVLNGLDYYFMNNLKVEGGIAWNEFAASRGFKSAICFPLKKAGKAMGTFNLYSADTDVFDFAEINMLAEAAGDISFTLDNFENAKKQRETEEQIIINERRYRALIEKSADMKTLTSREGQLTYGSPPIMEVLGYTAEEFLFKPTYYFVHPDDIAALTEKTTSIVQTPGKSFFCQLRLRNKNGTWIWCEGTVTNMFHDPDVNSLVSNFIDITEKKIADLQQIFDSNNLNALINNTKDLMWSVDKNFKLVTANKAFDKSVKLVSGGSIVKGNSIFAEGFPMEQLEKYKKNYERAFAGEAFSEMEHGGESPNEFWMEISYNPIRNGEEIIGAACHSREITSIKLAEIQLEFDGNNLNALINNTPDLMWSVDRNFNLITSNIPFDEMGKVNFGKTINRGDSILLAAYTPEMLNHFKHQYERAFAGEAFIQTEYFDYPVELWTEISYYPIRRGEEVIGTACHSRDITRLKKGEESIRKSEEKYRSLIEQASDTIIVIDKDNFILEINTVGEKLFGFSKDDLLGMKMKDLLFENDSPPHTMEIKEGKPVVYERTIKRKNGTAINVEVSASMISDGRILGIFRDISERKRAEEEREKITADIIQRNKDLEQFSYIVSHNLRAPVANIIGLSDAIQSENLAPALKKDLMDGLSHSIKKLDEVILDLNNILKMRREVNEKRELVNLSQLANDIHSSIENQIEKENAVIVWDFSEADEILTLRSYLHSIFYNLISNSLKYRQPNIPPVIEIKSRKLNGKIELIFKDNGMGIDLKTKGEQVFGLYKRFHTESAEGKGMGLYMVKTQVETIGGRISIESEVNKGTTFTIEFES